MRAAPRPSLSDHLLDPELLPTVAEQTTGHVEILYEVFRALIRMISCPRWHLSCWESEGVLFCSKMIAACRS